MSINLSTTNFQQIQPKYFRDALAMFPTSAFIKPYSTVLVCMPLPVQSLNQFETAHCIRNNIRT